MLQTIGKCIRVSWDKGLSTGGLFSIIPQARVSTWKERSYDISLVWLLLWSTGLSLTGQSEEQQGWALTSCSSELCPHNTMSYNKNIYICSYLCVHTHTHNFTSGSWHRAPPSIISLHSRILKLSDSQYGKKNVKLFHPRLLIPPWARPFQNELYCRYLGNLRWPVLKNDMRVPRAQTSAWAGHCSRSCVSGPFRLSPHVGLLCSRRVAPLKRVSFQSELISPLSANLQRWGPLWKLPHRLCR